MINSIKKDTLDCEKLVKRCKIFRIIAVSSWWIRDWWLFWMQVMVEHDNWMKKSGFKSFFQFAMGHPVTPCDLTSFFFDVFYIVSLHVFVKTLMNYHTHLIHHHCCQHEKIERSWQKSKHYYSKKKKEMNERKLVTNLNMTMTTPILCNRNSIFY